jgi:hypothetical protein
MRKTNVPNRRIAFRHETLMEELNMLSQYAHKNPSEGTIEQQNKGTKCSSAVPLSSNASSDMTGFPGATLIAERARTKSVDKDMTNQP